MSITIDLIPRGKENAITREQLCSLTGMNDGAVRKAIRKLIDEGAVIMSGCHTKGYYQPTSYDELDAYIEELTNKGLSCLKRANSAKEMRNNRSQLFMGLVEA